MKPLINLSRRERYYVFGAAGLLFIFLLFQLAIFPMLDKRERLSRALISKTAELEKMRGFQTEYMGLQKIADRARADLARRDKNFSLSSFLVDRLPGEIGIRDNVKNMKESPSTQRDSNVKMARVDLTLQSITMEQLADYLYRVEYSGNNLFVKRMSISKSSKSEGFIDVVMQVETVES